ncbi:hypothetical protein SLEP1_g37846 [Rubroshorea leprosula]|uniref:Translation initiation factor eIF2B subunit gamma n=1 Tax=Rubroshorea leprosula TaxID=152421 RepID=A0AAV5KW23_9ROSI|nr:hypothetical protein SLEP1_g37846 [Rubroshorea leprosula]
MDFQVVLLAGGTSKNLIPLEVPKALLPMANRRLISYVLEHLEQNNLKDLIVVVEGKDAALHVGGWISRAFVDHLHVEVVAVPEDVETAAYFMFLQVISGDLVSDVPPGAVVASHRRHGEAVTAVLCSAPVSGALEPRSGGGKDKIKKPGRYDIIGLDTTKQFLLCIATGGEIEKDTRIQKTIPCALGLVEIRSDLMDAHMYAFKRFVLQEVLDQKDTFQSLKKDVLPYLVQSQLK